MTDDAIITAFTAIEARQNKTPEGANYPQILTLLAVESGRSVEDVRELVLDTVLARPN